MSFPLACAQEIGEAVELPGELFAEPFPWLFWAVIAGAAVSSLALLFWARARKAEEVSLPLPPLAEVPSARERALERLRRVRAKEPRGEEEIREVYREASDILREFLAGQCRFPAPRMTSEEILAAFRADAAREDALRNLFSACDLVKFANQVPGAPERSRFLGAAGSFVEEEAP